MKKIGFLNFIIEPPTPQLLHPSTYPQLLRQPESKILILHEIIVRLHLAFYTIFWLQHRSNLSEVQKVQEMRIQLGGNRLLQSNTLRKQGLRYFEEKLFPASNSLSMNQKCRIFGCTHSQIICLHYIPFK